MKRKLPPFFYSVCLALFLVSFVLLGLARAAEQVSGPGEISRLQDPVIVLGTELPTFTGVPLNELRLYAYDGLNWQPIPFQIDEVTATGVYTTFEDGLLDANDEVVFMGADTDQPASMMEWVDNEDARMNPRYALTVTNPLQPAEIGYAYLYRAASLPASGLSYVNWDEAGQMLTAVSYTLGFDPTNFFGLAHLAINGDATDLLDRQKVRIDASFSGFPLPTFTEEDIDQLPIPPTVTLPISGPVRAVGGDGTSGFALYGGRADIGFAIDLSDGSIPGLHFDEVRLSLDWNNPTMTGWGPATYYDSNTPAGVPIDGVNDAIDLGTPFDWYEAIGSTGGLAVVVDVDPGNGTLSNYYRDDSTVDPEDTGDQQSFADTGLVITEPASGAIGPVTAVQALYILPPNAGNVGAVVNAWVDNPLQAAAVAQTLNLTHLLTVDKMASASAVSPGQWLTYTLTVNHQHVLSRTNNVVLTDTLPLGSTFVTATLPYTFDGSVVTWQRPSLGATETWEVALVVQIPVTATPGTMTNAVYGVRSDEVPVVWGTPVQTLVTSHFITLDKTAAAAVLPGDWLTYTLTVTNPVPWPTVHNLVLTDTVPDNTVFITASQPYTLDGTLVQWQAISLTTGTTWRVSLVVQVSEEAGGPVINDNYGVRSDEITVMGVPVTTAVLPVDTDVTIYLPYVARE